MRKFWQRLNRERAFKIKVALAFFLPGVLMSLIFSRIWPSAAGVWQGLSMAFYLVAYVLAGFNVATKAVSQLGKKDWTNEYFLMTVATIGALILKAWAEAAAIMIFYEIGEYAQNLAVERSRQSINKLIDLAADTALVRREGEWVEVDPYEVEPGEEILIQAGAKVPLDAVIVEGRGDLDTSGLTGEALPRPVEEGDEILSGSLNLNSVLVARATTTYEDSTINKIIELSGDAALRKGQTERLITRFARYYTPTVMLIALLVFLLPLLFAGGHWWVWLQRSMNLLVISCPCALVLSVPLSFFSGLGLASTRGILIKGSDVLEQLVHTHKMVFDKTGTLTSGQLDLVDLKLAADDWQEDNLLSLAHNLEQGSAHPTALAIRRAAQEKITPDKLQYYAAISEMKELPGRGITGKFEGQSFYLGNAKLMADLGLTVSSDDDNSTVVYFAEGPKLDAAPDQANTKARLIASFYFWDEVKPEAITTLAELHRLGVENLAMYSGDREPLVAKQAQVLGLDDYAGNLLPQEKLARLEKDIADKPKGSAVCFVGDGINDAPSLSLADVGIAMGNVGSDAAVEAADVVLIRDEIETIPEMIKISRKTMRVARQNIFLALGLKILIMALSIIGIGGMWLAIFADVGVTLICIANSFRITRGSSLDWVRSKDSRLQTNVAE
ncbi:MAG: heavy metal translocating P-type ATPase [Eubacteriales bacterium]|nr:heavy metal translocating P-type ATPase [Eubacteriales bacterium]